MTFRSTIPQAARPAPTGSAASTAFTAPTASTAFTAFTAIVRRATLTALSMIAALAIAPASAQLTYPGCTALQASDFQMTELFNRKGTSTETRDATLYEPTRMDVLTVLKNDGTFDHADIVIVERHGNVKFYDGTAKKVTVMGKIDVLGLDDNGLMGVAFDPDYARNRWLYLWYCPKELIGSQDLKLGNRQLRLTRIKVKPDNTLDMATEKILISILANKVDKWHSGGPMTFDAYGDLWVAVGNNSPDLLPGTMNVLSGTDSTQSAEWGSSNTASLRGGFFRIHPDSSAKGYSIPRGNFGEYWADQFEKKGDSALAKQYRDPKKVLPEVYVKGERSNFSIAVHPTKRWLAWGTVNWEKTYDEFNITDHPIFTGFPYFHKNNLKTGEHDKTVAAPKNNSPLKTGVADLPPAVPGAIVDLVNVAIGGPIYAFDHNLNSKDKFPLHFDNKWLVAGFYDGMWVATLDTNTLAVTNTLKVNTGVFSGFKVRNHVMSMYGKDGALYILNYSGYYDVADNPGVMRIAYKGSSCAPVAVAQAPKPEAYQKIWLSSTNLEIGEQGRHEFSLFDLSGRAVFRAEGDSGARYDFARLGAGAPLRKGVYVVKVRTAQGLFMRRISLM
jgi:cytochrome c